MLALRIYINGEYVVTAGQEDWCVLAMHLSATRREDAVTDRNLRFSVGGLSKLNEQGFRQHFRWQERELTEGDKVEIEIVESEEVTEPKKRFRSDHEVQESSFTDEEAKEMRYQDYLELKKEFDVSNT